MYRQIGIILIRYMPTTLCSCKHQLSKHWITPFWVGAPPDSDWHGAFNPGKAWQIQLLRSCCQDASFISNERIPFPKEKSKGDLNHCSTGIIALVGTSRTRDLFPIHELHHRLFLLSISNDYYCNASKIYPIFQCFILDDQITVFFRIQLSKERTLTVSCFSSTSFRTPEGTAT